MLRPGQQIGSYRILSTLGSGGMGEVYRAHDATLGRDVAIKVLPPAFTSDPDRLNRFEREARILASLNHPNIATIHGVERGIGIDALVLEVVEGETLAERLERETSRSGIPVPEAVNIARQIAEALEAAHEKGIVHRDLKPANVKIRPDGVVKVLDFGLAKAVEADVYKGDISKAPTMTISRQTEGILVGTVAYMSPEQAAGKPVDRRADIWAFGVLLFEMVTGRRLFAGDSVQELLVAILTREPSLDGVATGVRAIVERCLRRDPRRRWQSIGDVRLALEEGLIEVPSRPAVPASSRLPWVLVAVLLLALSTGALLRIREAPARRTSVHFAVTGAGRGLLHGELRCFARWKESGNRGHARRKAAVVRSRDRLGSGAPDSGHGGRGLSILVCRQPTDRVLCRQVSEARCRRGRSGCHDHGDDRLSGRDVERCG